MEITEKPAGYLSSLLSVQVLLLLGVGMLLGVYWTHCSRPADVLIGLAIMGIAMHLTASRDRSAK